MKRSWRLRLGRASLNHRGPTSADCERRAIDLLRTLCVSADDPRKTLTSARKAQQIADATLTSWKEIDGDELDRRFLRPNEDSFIEEAIVDGPTSRTRFWRSAIIVGPDLKGAGAPESMAAIVVTVAPATAEGKPENPGRRRPVSAVADVPLKRNRE